MKKTKLLAKVMLLAILVTGVISLSGCTFARDVPVVLDKEIPNLDEQGVSYLLIRNLNNYEYITDVDYLHYSINGGFEIKNGESIYNPAIIEISAGFDGDGLYKESNFIYLTNSVSISIKCDFYPVKGDVGELEYEFKYIYPSHYKYNKVVYIHSNSQLVGKVYYDTQKTVEESWIENFLSDNLVLMTVKNYSDSKKEFDNIEENITSYLSVGNIANSQYCSDVLSYSSKIEDGLYIEYGSQYYSNIINTVVLNFKGDESTNFSNISIRAEFYEYKKTFDLLRYEIGENDTINIYNGDVLVGKIDIYCLNSISYEWIEKFLDDSLIVVEVKNR